MVLSLGLSLVPNNHYVTTNFSYNEWVKSSTASKNKIENDVPKKFRTNLARISIKLEEVRDILGAPIRITSGYRSGDLNVLVGGSEKSFHMKALAVDFQTREYTPKQIIDKLLKSGFTDFDQLINEFDIWVHLGIQSNNKNNRNQVLVKKMKKITIALFSLILMVGCSKTKGLIKPSTNSLCDSCTQKTQRYRDKMALGKALCTLQSKNWSKQQLLISIPGVVFTGGDKNTPSMIINNPSIPPFNMPACIASVRRSKYHAIIMRGMDAGEKLLTLGIKGSVAYGIVNAVRKGNGNERANVNTVTHNAPNNLTSINDKETDFNVQVNDTKTSDEGTVSEETNDSPVGNQQDTNDEDLDNNSQE